MLLKVKVGMSVFALLLSVILLLIAGVHIYWAHGGLWPGVDRQDLIDRVYGGGDKFPPPFACYVVAIILALFGLIPLLKRDMLPAPNSMMTWLDLCHYGVMGIFAIRGIGGYFLYRGDRWSSTFVRLNNTIYNPLCIAIALLYFLLI